MSDRKPPSTRKRAAAIAEPPAVERFRGLSAAEKRQRIESGRVTFRNRTLVFSGMKKILCNGCTIVGDGNHVHGNHNLIRGKNNSAQGLGNRFKQHADPPPQPPAPLANAVDYQIGEMIANAALAHMADESSSEQSSEASGSGEDDDEVVEIAMPRRAPRPPMPAVGTDPAHSPWKACLLDLPDYNGAPEPCTSEQLRCIVCLENRFDTLFEPCHHLCCCRACAKRLYQPDSPLPLCPQCRIKIEYSSIVH